MEPRGSRAPAYDEGSNVKEVVRVDLMEPIAMEPVG